MQNLVLNRERLVELGRCDRSFVMSLFHHGLDNDTLAGGGAPSEAAEEGEVDVFEDVATELMVNTSVLSNAIEAIGGYDQISTVSCDTGDMWDKEYQTMSYIAEGGPKVIMDGALSRDGNIVVGFDALIVREDGMWDVFFLSSKSSNLSDQPNWNKTMKTQYTEARPLIYVLSAPEHISHVANFYVMSANKRYLTPYPDPETGDIAIDPNEAMFQISMELGDDINPEMADFMHHIEQIYANIASDPFWIPEAQMGSQCNQPYTCPYHTYCTRRLDPDSIDLWLDNYWDRKRLMQAGYTTMQELLQLSYDYPGLEDVPSDAGPFTISDSGLRCLRMYEQQHL